MARAPAADCRQGDAAGWLPLETKERIMKQGIHPNIREVVFQDMSNGKTFIISSTIQTRESIELDGKTYPLAKVEVSSESHPFYTGEQNKFMDTTGRVEKFRQKFGNRASAKVAK
ncbi:LSU ribosomal protein L31P [Mycetohabitans rhizoxinica HKI 454]|uniref:50S ribosomal protein L31 n=2 Tax=Mycetohabitans rhizoxinica TaxID=412963 RepID=E5AQG4_MYCRK|nr:LSU ribosomal protein L31P [Mycetohabitans rhizoxinica HKI 454]